MHAVVVVVIVCYTIHHLLLLQPLHPNLQQSPTTSTAGPSELVNGCRKVVAAAAPEEQ